jgi:glycosyltransferase involved in cell wall biosynthesis
MSGRPTPEATPVPPAPATPGLVSVVIPVHDNVSHAGAAIDSVLAQSYEAVEVVIVDDGSSDGSAELVSSYGDRVNAIRQPNRGVSAARNRGVAAATGEYLAFLDADDLFPPRRCEQVAAALTGRPDVDAVVGTMDEFLAEGIADAGSAGMRPPRRGVPARVPGTLTIRRRAFDVVGGFDEALVGSEAIDWFVRAGAAGIGIDRLDTVVLERRLHGANASLTDPERLRDQYLGIVVSRVRAARRPGPSA